MEDELCGITVVNVASESPFSQYLIYSSSIRRVREQVSEMRFDAFSWSPCKITITWYRSSKYRAAAQNYLFFEGGWEVAQILQLQDVPCCAASAVFKFISSFLFPVRACFINIGAEALCSQSLLFLSYCPNDTTHLTISLCCRLLSFLTELSEQLSRSDLHIFQYSILISLQIAFITSLRGRMLTCQCACSIYLGRLIVT